MTLQALGMLSGMPCVCAILPCKLCLLLSCFRIGSCSRRKARITADTLAMLHPLEQCIRDVRLVAAICCLVTDTSANAVSSEMTACDLHNLSAGRWKGALVAVKVIDHRIKGNGNAVDIQRETILSTSVVHPNVVSSNFQSDGAYQCSRHCKLQASLAIEAQIWSQKILLPVVNCGRCRSAAVSS